MKNEILFVSLGPSDAELITLKSYKALQNADYIFCPQTTQGSSRAVDIIDELGIDLAKIIRYTLPMSYDRDGALGIYRKVAEDAIQLADNNKKIVITAEGDAGFYSSSQYINDYIIERNINTRRIPGIPAFIACSALANFHLVTGDNSVEIVTQVNSAEDILAALKDNKTLVIMKLPKSQNAIMEFLGKEGNYTTYYFENVGVEGKEFYTKSIDHIRSIKKFPYFSIMIIK